MSPSISIDSKYSFQFPYRQIRAKLIRTSKSDFQENSNYGTYALRQNQLCYIYL